MKRLGLIIVACFLVVGCDEIKNMFGGEEPKTDKPIEKTQETSNPGDKNILAKINGEEITDAEVTAKVKNRLSKIEAQIFDIKMDGLQDMVEEKLLTAEAKKQNTTVDGLLKSEVKDKVAQPTEQEIKNFYEFAKGRLNNQPLEAVREQLVRQMTGSKEKTLYGELVTRLRKEASVEMYMERPRAVVSVDDDPSKGDKDAPIQLIEFSDFQCPFCKKTRPTIDQIMTTYSGKVHYVFRDFPLSFHKLAPKAHQAATCAGDQDKYWEYNAILWENQKAIELTNLKKYAGDLKLNQKKFDDCLDSNKYQSEIDKDTADGSAAGVSGTPAYFINGIFISGAQPYEKFQEVIDEELRRLKK